MTREQAKEIFLNRGYIKVDGGVVYEGNKWREACMVISEQLKEEPILDKIRAEILQLDYDIEDVDYDYNDMAQTQEVHMICREEVLQIIDKYKQNFGFYK